MQGTSELETQERADAAIQVQKWSGGRTFCSLRATHIVEGSWLCSVSNDLNVNSYQRSNLIETSRVVFDQTPEYCGLANLTHNIITEMRGKTECPYEQEI